MQQSLVENTVVVEVHFTAVGGFDKSIPLTGNKFRHMAMVFRFMRLDLAAHFASGILDLALCRRECILDRDHDVLVFGCIAVSFTDEDILMIRHRDANIDLEQSPCRLFIVGAMTVT